MSVAVIETVSIVVHCDHIVIRISIVSGSHQCRVFHFRLKTARISPDGSAGILFRVPWLQLAPAAELVSIVDLETDYR